MEKIFAPNYAELLNFTVIGAPTIGVSTLVTGAHSFELLYSIDEFASVMCPI